MRYRSSCYVVDISGKYQAGSSDTKPLLHNQLSLGSTQWRLSNTIVPVTNLWQRRRCALIASTPTKKCTSIPFLQSSTINHLFNTKSGRIEAIHICSYLPPFSPQQQLSLSPCNPTVARIPPPQPLFQSSTINHLFSIKLGRIKAIYINILLPPLTP